MKAKEMFEKEEIEVNNIRFVVNKKKIKVFKLTPTERKALYKIEEFKEIYGRRPKLIEIQEMMGYKHPCTAYDITFKLECKGYDYKQIKY